MKFRIGDLDIEDIVDCKPTAIERTLRLVQQQVPCPLTPHVVHATCYMAHIGMSLVFCDQMALYEANPNKGM